MSPVTPEQVRRMEEQRLKAKALRSQQSASARLNASHGIPSSGVKRSHDQMSVASGQASSGPEISSKTDSEPVKVQRPLDDIQVARKFTKYVDYDFSKMTDTKGGFLTAEDDPHNRALHAPNQDEKPAHMTMAEWERHQLLKKLRDQRAGPFEPGLSTIRRADKVCRECKSMEIDWQWEQVYGCMVCNSCKEKYPDKYSQLTKTEAKEDYLLTDPELNDKDLFPRLERPNPHKATYHNMQLYLRCQLEEYAFSDKKWGSAEKLDEEYQKRNKEKKAKKEAKFKNKLLDLKKRTRVDAFRRGRDGDGGQFGDRIESRRGEKHDHVWGRSLETSDGTTVKKCVECGMEIEEFEL